MSITRPSWIGLPKTGETVAPRMGGAQFAGLFGVVYLVAAIIGLASWSSWISAAPSLTIPSVLTSLMIGVIVLLLLPREIVDVSSMLLHLFVWVALVPALALAANGLVGFGLVTLLALPSAVFLLLAGTRHAGPRALAWTGPIVGERTLMFIAAISSAYLLVPMLDLGSFDLSVEIFKRRADSRSRLEEQGVWATYLAGQLRQGIIPAMAGVCAFRGLWLRTLFWWGLGVAFFVFLHHKGSVVHPGFGIFVGLCVRWGTACLIPGCLAAVVLVGALVGTSREPFGMPPWPFVDRALFVPVRILEEYSWIYTSPTEWRLWLDTLPARILGLSGVEGALPAERVGMQFGDAFANVGFIGSGYANAGMWGVMLYVGVLSGLVLACSRWIPVDRTRAAAVMLAPSVVLLLTSSDLATLVSSHGGVGVAIGLVLLMASPLRRPEAS